MKPRKKLDPSRYRTRYDPPTLDEAVFAAQGLTDDVDGQVEIAARLIGLPETEVRSAVLRSRPVARSTEMSSGHARRVVVVERKNSRIALPRKADLQR